MFAFIPTSYVLLYIFTYLEENITVEHVNNNCANWKIVFYMYHSLYKFSVFKY